MPAAAGVARAKLQETIEVHEAAREKIEREQNKSGDPTNPDPVGIDLDDALVDSGTGWGWGWGWGWGCSWVCSWGWGWG